MAHAARSLADAELEEAEAFRAIGDLGQRGVDAVQAWIASGCKGPELKRDAAARARLSKRLDAAIRAREALSRREDTW